MKIKYVEAMVDPSPPSADGCDISTGDLSRAVSAVDQAYPEPYASVDMTEFERSAYDAIAKRRETISALVLEFETLEEQIEEHSCGDDNAVPLIPVSSSIPIWRQFETGLFLPGEVVAIVRLSDLQLLLSEHHDLRVHMLGLCESAECSGATVSTIEGAPV